MEKPPKAPKHKAGESWRAEPTLPKQRALLEFLKQSVPLSRNDASYQIAAIFESPGGNAHERAWNAAKFKLRPDLYPAKAKNKPRPQTAGFSVINVLKLTIVLAGLLYALHCFLPDSNSSGTNGETVVTIPVPAPSSTDNRPPPSSTDNRPTPSFISLKSTDGRMIRARILTLTKDRVLIRREDGRTFDLPLNRLTSDSKKRIDEYVSGK